MQPRNALFAAALLVTGCGGAAQIVPTVHTTRRVTIVGERADTFAETIEGPVHGHMFVRAHDGRELWVRQDGLGVPAIVEGAWVLVADRGGIVPAQVVDVLDDFLEVRVGELVGMAPMHAVLAILHAAPREPVTVEPAVTAEESDEVSRPDGTSEAASPMSP